MIHFTSNLYFSVLAAPADKAVEKEVMDPLTLVVLSEVYQQAEDKLSHECRTDEAKIGLATRILVLAQAGERDPKRLLTAALYWVKARETGVPSPI